MAHISNHHTIQSNYFINNDLFITENKLVVFFYRLLAIIIPLNIKKTMIDHSHQAYYSFYPASMSICRIFIS